MNTVDLGASARLVFPHTSRGPVAFNRGTDGVWRREGIHVPESPKGYLYFAIAFSLFVEFLSFRINKKK